ncbi:MAG: Glycine cleavage system H protein [Candidatus Anoxychlamydiales bacterium]|nr:Glycine cleavage system H protein [Candidatus Anoxychlamydiales bacterium]NGX35612.1 Glycine cleavage system H protein [Candidatus Anoxychlamydiales bacterium]
MKFSATHEWAELNGDIATIGVTNFGRMHLGDVVNIGLPEVGKNVSKDQEVCVIESNKAAVDLHSPLTGEIVEVNDKLKNDLSILNKSPEDQGWLFKVKINDKSEYENLMSLEEYEKKVSE